MALPEQPFVGPEYLIYLSKRLVDASEWVVDGSERGLDRSEWLVHCQNCSIYRSD